MAGFADAWLAVARRYSGKRPSSELRPLLQDVYTGILSDPLNPAAIKESLVALLEYLGGPGRTNANCSATDRFFCTSDGWETDWTERGLPDEIHDVLAMMGEALHDTVKAPEIAANFDCLPEQLLERVRNLAV